MINRLFFAAAFVSALGTGLVGGAFFAFSTFVMPALARLAPVQGIAAMQSINVTVLRPPFMLAMFGTAALCIALALRGLLRWSMPGSGWFLVASVVYLAGTIIVTMAFNVPRNDALSALPTEGAAAAAFWPRFLAEWTPWNHVRTVTSLAASALLMVGLIVQVFKR